MAVPCSAALAAEVLISSDLIKAELWGQTLRANSKTHFTVIWGNGVRHPAQPQCTQSS